MCVCAGEPMSLFNAQIQTNFNGKCQRTHSNARFSSRFIGINVIDTVGMWGIYLSPSLLCVCLCLRRRVKYTELRLGTKESMWLPQIIWFKMVMKATRNLILLKWTLSPVPVPLHSYLTAHAQESMWNAMCVTHIKSTSHIVNTINALEIDYNFLWKLFCYLWVCDRSQDVYPHFQWI